VERAWLSGALFIFNKEGVVKRKVVKRVTKKYYGSVSGDFTTVEFSKKGSLKLETDKQVMYVDVASGKNRKMIAAVLGLVEASQARAEEVDRAGSYCDGIDFGIQMANAYKRAGREIDYKKQPRDAKS
jgi:hypothetical protein